MNARYPIVAARARYRCEYCHAPEVIASFPFEVEHVVPVSRGGANDLDNLALACRACNLFKSNHIEAVDPESGEIVPLFHPRLHLWEEHFAWDAEQGLLMGRTAIGRATASLLQFDTPQQQEARRLWIRLGLFP